MILIVHGNSHINILSGRKRSDLIVSALVFGSRSPGHVPDWPLGLYVDFTFYEASPVW